MLFLPHPPKEALRTGTEMWLAENRWVACVFFNFHQLEAHTAMVAQEVVATIQALIQKHEGDLHQARPHQALTRSVSRMDFWMML